MDESKKEHLLLLRSADSKLRQIPRSQIPNDAEDLLKVVHDLLWMVNKKIENGK